MSATSQGELWFQSATEVPKNYIEVENQDVVHTWINSTTHHYTYRDASDWSVAGSGGTSTTLTTASSAPVTTYGQAKVFQSFLSGKHLIQPVLVGDPTASRDLQILVTEMDGDATTDSYFTQTYSSAVPGSQVIFRLTACEYGIFCIYAVGDYDDFTFVTFTYSGAGYADVGGISTTPSPAVVGFPGNPVVEGTCTYVTRTEVLCHEPLPNGRINFLTILPEVNGSTVDYPIVDYGSPDLGVSVFHIQVIRKLQGTNWATGFVDANLNHYMALANGNLADFDVGVTVMTGETGPAVARKVSIGNDLSESESYLNYPALTWTGMFDLNPGSLDYLTVPIMTTVLTVPRALYLEPQATPTFVGPKETMWWALDVTVHNFLLL